MIHYQYHPFCSDSERELLLAIEEYTGEEIEQFDITKDEYKEILNDSDDGSNNWKKLIDNANKEDGTEEEWWFYPLRIIFLELFLFA